MHIEDIIDKHEKSESETYMLNNYLHEKKELFEKIFQRYVSASHDDEEPLVHDQGFHVFLKNCHIVSSNFSIAEADILMQHAHKRGGNRSVNSFANFKLRTSCKIGWCIRTTKRVNHL